MKNIDNDIENILSEIESSIAEEQETPITPHTPEESASILDDIYSVLDRHVIMDKQDKIAATLWCAFTWIVEACDIAPMAYITAPEKRSGKSVLLNVMSKMCANPLPASNVSTGSIFRIMDTKPTLMMDECDTFLAQSRSKDIVGIINSGHTRSSAYVVRCNKDGQAIKYNTFGAKALCGIGKFGSDTIRDRSIIIELRRKMVDETVEKLSDFDPNTIKHFEALTARLQKWCAFAMKKCSGIHPMIPEQIGSDRAKDNWIPLLAIADLAGEVWAKKAREVAVYISNRATKDDDLECGGVRVLALIRDAFSVSKKKKLSTFDLLESINGAIEKKLNAFQLARILKSFEIYPKTIRMGGRGSATPKGYQLADFADAFKRYLPNTSTNNDQPLDE